MTVLNGSRGCIDRQFGRSSSSGDWNDRDCGNLANTSSLILLLLQMSPPPNRRHHRPSSLELPPQRFDAHLDILNLIIPNTSRGRASLKPTLGEQMRQTGFPLETENVVLDDVHASGFCLEGLVELLGFCKDGLGGLSEGLEAGGEDLETGFEKDFEF